MEDSKIIDVARQTVAAYRQLNAELDSLIAELEDGYSVYREMRIEVALLNASIVLSE